MAAKVHIGTSGWHYAHWRGTYYPASLPSSEMLSKYIEEFDTVELNNSFYRLPERSTFLEWKHQTPDNFLFSVKASRYLTHNKKLLDPKEPLQRLLYSARGLGKKLGPILVQFPPRWRVNVDRLAAFLRLLPKSIRFTFEFRELSWLTNDVYELLRQHNCAFCIYELDGYETPHIVTADWSYIRLHGPDGKYQGSYSNAQLQTWAKELIGWRRKLTDIYVYFDNDQLGYAPRNALTLKQMIMDVP